ncbi:MAG TPA: hypothetical protein VLB50_00700 [Ignavibacteriaceae bacterium]|nr:hypothetical protein [Ignavibacteriaceae bacterium]
MIRILYIINLLVLAAGLISASTIEKVEKTGTITYMSSQNIYVKFENTAGITQGDTLFQRIDNKLLPAMIVKFISSKSVAGETVNGLDLKVDDKLIAVIEKIVPDVNEEKQSPIVTVPSTPEGEFKADLPPKNPAVKQKASLKGRFSIQSYSNISNSPHFADNQRWRYTFSLNAKNIGESNLSFSNYMSFAYRADQWSDMPNNFGRSLRIYDLALNYQFDETTSLWVGRHINFKISNISSVDGVQFEKGFDRNYVGVVAGSRPNFTDLGINLKLFEYGAFIGRDDSLGSGYMRNTLAVFEQTNDFKTDRRFIYFQHSNSILENTNVFVSSEMDLYKMISGIKKNDFQLTSIFASLQYSPITAVSFYLSYDARKNVIYYETFKNFIDSVFENETRQGFNLRLNIKPIRFLFVGLNGGYRFQKNDLKPARNFGGYITYSEVPLIEITPTISYSKIITSYIDGGVAGLRLSRNITDNIDLSVYYRNTQYKFNNSIASINQNSVSFDLSTILLNPVFLTLSYEGIFEKTSTAGRILLDLTTRF